MGKNDEKYYSRREFVKTSLCSAAVFASSTIGCASLPKTSLPSIDYAATVILKNCHVVDVNNSQILKNRTIWIRNGRIHRISGPLGENENRDGPQSTEIDLKWRYISPGLIDAHCHTTIPSAGGFSILDGATLLHQLKRNFVQQIFHGVTTVRDMGALPKYLHDFLTDIKNGDLIGPDVYYCNAFTNIYGSHPDIDPSDISIFAKPVQMISGNQSLWFQDNDELKDKMAKNVENGASFIKLTMDDVSVLCGKEKIPVYSDKHLKTIRDFAEKNNLYVSGHLHKQFGFNRALEYSIHSMEHSVDTPLSDAQIQEMAKKKIANIPTVIIAQMFAPEEAFTEIPEEYRNDFIDNELNLRRAFLNAKHDAYIESVIHDANVKSLEAYRKYSCEAFYQKGIFLTKPRLFFNILKYAPENLKRMHAAGVLIGCGTDSGIPFIYHGSLWREMEMLTRIGFSNQQVIQFATINNAKILRQNDSIGSIEHGKRADLVVIDSNPFKKIETYREPSAVIKDGKLVFTKSKLKTEFSIS